LRLERAAADVKVAEHDLLIPDLFRDLVDVLIASTEKLLPTARTSAIFSSASSELRTPSFRASSPRYWLPSQLPSLRRSSAPPSSVRGAAVAEVVAVVATASVCVVGTTVSPHAESITMPARAKNDMSDRFFHSAYLLK
jgi:hypothetical protein